MGVEMIGQVIEPGDVVGLDLRVVGTLFLGDGFFRAVGRGGAVRLGDLGLRLVGVEHRVAYDVDLREDDVALIAEELEILRVLELDLLPERETHDLGRLGAERFAVGVVLLVVRVRLELHDRLHSFQATVILPLVALPSFDASCQARQLTHTRVLGNSIKLSQL